MLYRASLSRVPFSTLWHSSKRGATPDAADDDEMLEYI